MEPFTNANKPTTIKKFIEHKLDKSIKWLETDTGRKYKCDESIISKLWWHWIVDKSARRADTQYFAVFEYDNPKTLIIDELISYDK